MMIDDTICAVSYDGIDFAGLGGKELLTHGIRRRLGPDGLAHPRHTHVVLALRIASVAGGKMATRL